MSVENQKRFLRRSPVIGKVIDQLGLKYKDGGKTSEQQIADGIGAAIDDFLNHLRGGLYLLSGGEGNGTVDLDKFRKSKQTLPPEKQT